jgi:aminomethyltransferase
LADLDAGTALEFPGGVAWKARMGEVGGIEVLCDPEAADRLHPPGTELPGAQAAFEVLRIEAGRPAFGLEITEDTIPLEVGLWDAVSFTKGCYIGQEIIARMDSRGKLAKRLTGIRLSGPVTAPASLTQADGELGRLTSAAESPRSGWVGLCIVRPARLTPGLTSVKVEGTDVVGELLELGVTAEEKAPTLNAPSGLIA